MTRRFADTFFYLAILNARDAAHERAVALSRSLRGGFVTTEFVVLELADGMAHPPARETFIHFSALLRDDRRSK
jgi:predicted nucleic acid-binding protein